MAVNSHLNSNKSEDSHDTQFLATRTTKYQLTIKTQK